MPPRYHEQALAVSLATHRVTVPARIREEPRSNHIALTITTALMREVCEGLRVGYSTVWPSGMGWGYLLLELLEESRAYLEAHGGSNAELRAIPQPKTIAARKKYRIRGM